MSIKIKQLFEWLLTLLKLLKNDPAKAREFSELVTNQYDFLVEKIEQFQTDYIELCERVKILYVEITSLREEISKSAGLKCGVTDCNRRLAN